MKKLALVVAAVAAFALPTSAADAATPHHGKSLVSHAIDWD